MPTNQRFGGNWTEEKLDILSDYLDFYLEALKNQPFKKVYIDAFAGTGSIIKNEKEIEGSARLALSTKRKFDRYIFVESKPQYADELSKMVISDFSALQDKIEIYNDDCNTRLLELCSRIDWNNSRAILFLDPYAMDVKWDTLEAIAATKAIDVWYLFPLSAANRLMRRDGRIEKSWKDKLNMIFGDAGWFQEFYKKDPQMNFFGEDDKVIKSYNADALKNYICQRLNTLFAAVARNPRILYNTKNSPLFLFCFAVSNDNPKAIALAMKVADYILKFSGK